MCLSFIAFLTILYYRNIFALEKNLITVESYDDLLSDVLELRRYEKNFIYTGDVKSLRQNALYLTRVERLTDKLADSIVHLIGRPGFEAFQKVLYRYKSTMQSYGDPSKVQSVQIDQNDIRDEGKELVGFAQKMIRLNRQRIQKNLANTLGIPLAFVGIFIGVVIVLFQFVNRGILKPLAVVQSATQQVAKGSFEPILSDKTKGRDEISALIEAFNKMADEIRSGQEQLLQSRKMASIGTLTSGIAHELNNPLNNISLTAESLQMTWGETADAESREMIQDILNQADRASQVVKNLLEFSRTERPFLTDLDFRDVIEGAIRLIKNQLVVSGVELETQMVDKPLTIRGRRQDLQQALINILLNSIQAMSDGGHIRIRVTREGDKYIRADLEDTGCGIKPADLEHIFDPFFTTKAVGQGTGLGLSLTYGIIRTHRGYIEVKSEVGRGTVFSVYLPAVDHSGTGG